MSVDKLIQSMGWKGVISNTDKVRNTDNVDKLYDNTLIIYTVNRQYDTNIDNERGDTIRTLTMREVLRYKH